MGDITISGEVAERLQKIARNTHRTVEEVVEDALKVYLKDEAIEDVAGMPPRGTLARMAWVARRNPIEVEATDTADRSREILRSEYAEHLLKRLIVNK